MKNYSEWGIPRKIFTNIAFWLPVQLLIIILVEHLGLLPSNLSPFKSGFCGPKGGVMNYSYTVACCEAGLVYTILGSILISTVKLGTKKFWIWFSILYFIYMVVTFVMMADSIGAWFYEGFGCYIFDVWVAPLLWLGELFLAKYLYNSSKKRIETTE